MFAGQTTKAALFTLFLLTTLMGEKGGNHHHQMTANGWELPFRIAISVVNIWIALKYPTQEQKNMVTPYLHSMITYLQVSL